MSTAAAGSLLIVGCGDDDDFENEPRPPVPVQLTGVITPERVTVSPQRVKPGPIVLIVSNQTDGSHTIRIKGPSIDERVGPINPEGTGTVQATLRRTNPGEPYEVSANSSQGAVNPEDVIRPAKITVVGEPDSSSDELLLP